MPKKQNTAWIMLIGAGLLEIVWAYFMKLSHGFTVIVPTIIVIVCLTISFFLLGKAVDTLGIGLSYAIFTGIGIAGTTIIGIFVLNEGVSILKVLSLLILLVGILGLKFAEGTNPVIEQKEDQKK